MLYRNKPPNQNRWNGLGGKIERGETPRCNIYREIMEEAEIDLHQAKVRFTGLVTWPCANDSASRSGMYVFLAWVAPDTLWHEDRVVVEGLLAWKPLQWLYDPHNTLIVENIPCFLPRMLVEAKPQEYFFPDKGSMECLPLPAPCISG